MATMGYVKTKSFATRTQIYTKVDQSERWMVWEVTDRDRNFICWEVWAPKNGIFKKPKTDDFGITGFYCIRKEDVTFWKRNL